jgi:hypothetical protein
MTAQWIFQELRPGVKDRQPTQGEFFATDAIRSEAEALVRETIQNSLDAKMKGAAGPVRVRFHLANGTHALSAKVAHSYFKNGWSHFCAANNGLDDVPNVSDDCPFLVAEDFGTTGLIGDVNQYRHIPDRKNPFYYFFRTEGRSGKSEEDRGRWGIGKYVFPRSSRINAFIALTVRNDDAKRLLMGQTVLKSHTVGTKYFTPDGDYGLPNGDGLVLPVTDQDSIDQFCQDFKLRRNHEPGLSVVVPWIDEEFTMEALLRSVIEGYFYPIVAEGLVVTVSNGGDDVELNKDTLVSASTLLGEEFASKMLPLLQLATWVRDLIPTSVVSLAPANPNRPTWEPSMIPQSLLPELRTKFRSGEKLAIKVPLTIREHNKSPRESFFRIFLLNDSGDEGEPVFIRDGIIISDVRSHWIAGVRSLVLIDDAPLATLLGDAENPAHTQWQKDREHFRHKYTYGKSYIEFVSHSVSMFVRFLNESDERPDRDLLRDIFSIPKPKEPNAPKEKSKPRKRNKGEVIRPDPKIEPRKRRYTLSKVTSGFTITKGQPGASIPNEIIVSVAYDRRRGSALGKYSHVDFKMNEAPIRVEVEGGKITEKQLNRLIVRVVESDFKVTVTGFDENRDLFVDVDAKEAADDSKA